MRNCFYLCFLLWIFSHYLSSGDHCASFDFPTVNGSVVSVPENTNITIPFQLIDDGCAQCAGTGSFKIVISKQDKKTRHFGDFCDLLHVRGTCVQPSQDTDCGCPGEDGMYQFHKLADRSDSTTWVWMMSNDIAAERIVNFHVTYPAVINELTLSAPSAKHHGTTLFPASTRVHVTCRWKDGDVPAEARLLDRYGLELLPVRSSQQEMSYTFHEVGCQDAGLIRCEALGASHNKTTTVLVKCPPEFEEANYNITTFVNQTVELHFELRAHTTDMTQCKLIRAASNSSVNSDDQQHIREDFISFSNLTGTPPDLTLTVRLDNVRKEDEGQWRLELTNDAGTGHVDFFLHVDETNGFRKQTSTTILSFDDNDDDSDENFVTHPLPAQSEKGENMEYIIGGVIGSFLFIGAAIVAVIILKNKRAMRDRASKYQYPIGNADRILMRPVSTLAVRDPSYNGMASHGCHVVRDLFTHQVDFIADGEYQNRFHRILPSPQEED